MYKRQASDLLELPPVKILCKHDGEEYGNDYSDDDSTDGDKVVYSKSDNDELC